MKRWLVISLLAMMALSFVGCQNGSDGSVSQESSLLSVAASSDESPTDNTKSNAGFILEYRNIEQTCNSVRFYNSLIIQHQI